ncbi:hypothetical protein [Halomonas sp. NO4]|uniref:hypothetical protein n=1 Tax=Halomonas sp. NO4 TaxID=2484813 RepID=UPI0013CF5DBC|nr:hypothetical protein [Halomonas sp. NO4]
MNQTGKAALDEMRDEVRAMACRYMERAKAFRKAGDEQAAGGLKIASQELHCVADEVHQAGMTRTYRPEPKLEEEQLGLTL